VTASGERVLTLNSAEDPVLCWRSVKTGDGEAVSQEAEVNAWPGWFSAVLLHFICTRSLSHLLESLSRSFSLPRPHLSSHASRV
jgi:hypothetical protein